MNKKSAWKLSVLICYYHIVSCAHLGYPHNTFVFPVKGYPISDASGSA